MRIMTAETIAALAAAIIDKNDLAGWPILAYALEEVGADENLICHFKAQKWGHDEVAIYRLAGRPTPAEAIQAGKLALALAEAKAAESAAVKIENGDKPLC